MQRRRLCARAADRNPPCRPGGPPPTRGGMASRRWLAPPLCLAGRGPLTELAHPDWPFLQHQLTTALLLLLGSPSPHTYRTYDGYVGTPARAKDARARERGCTLRIRYGVLQEFARGCTHGCTHR
jgi:hypothetical protein